MQDKLYRRIQKYTERIPAFILGSGASIPYGLPSMESLAGNICDQLDAKYKGQKVWDEIYDKFTSGMSIEDVINYGCTEDIINDIIKCTWEYINNADNLFFNKLFPLRNNSEKGDLFPLSVLFKHFINSTPSTLHVITTNYDNIAEYACDLCKSNAINGFSGAYIKEFNVRAFDNVANIRNVYIYKVHGSINWYIDKKDQILSLNHTDTIPKDFLPLIVTPGSMKYEKVLTTSILRNIQNFADEIIKSASCFICIGYGFNDRHVHPILTEYVSDQNIPIIILSKKLTENAKLFLSTCHKYIALEQSSVPEKTNVFWDNEADMSIDGNLWSLDEFISVLI